MQLKWYKRLLHAVCNGHDPLDSGSHAPNPFSQSPLYSTFFYQNIIPSNSMARASPDLRNEYLKTAQDGDSTDEIDFQSTAFRKSNGDLDELDGALTGPIDLGTL